MAQNRREFLKSASVVGAVAASRWLPRRLVAARVQPRAAQNVRMIRTAVLDIGYEEAGNSAGFPIILLHGFP